MRTFGSNATGRGGGGQGAARKEEEEGLARNHCSGLGG